MSPKKYRLQKVDHRWWKKNISCLNACPAHTNVPDYIARIAEGRFQEAFNLNRKANVFPAILGRVCMHPCETACRRGYIDEPVAICALKRAAADHKPTPIHPIPRFFLETGGIWLLWVPVRLD
jgi:formate dehydrogenase major subunit